MGEQEFMKRFKLDDELLRKFGFNPYYPRIQAVDEDHVIIDGEQFITLASNNYLGLANDARVKEAAIRAATKYGVSMCATPIATGYTDLSDRVEKKLARFLGLEDAIIYPSCYQANNGLFSIIAGREDVVFIDRFAHSSLVEGVRAVGCKIRPFLHNNLDNLESILKRSAKYRQAFVVTESVFSTEGSIAPADGIFRICEKYNAIPVIDDSHGIGVIGENGKGVLEHFKISGFKGIYTTSLGKALANSGGVIAGKKSLITYLKYYSSHLVYSTAIPPSILAGLEKTIEIIENEFATLSKTMWKYKNMIQDSLKDKKFMLNETQTPINSILVGYPESTLLLAKKLYENRILSTPFIHPSVPLSKGVIRLIATCNMKESTVNKACEILSQI